MRADYYPVISTPKHSVGVANSRVYQCGHITPIDHVSHYPRQGVRLCLGLPASSAPNNPSTNYPIFFVQVNISFEISTFNVISNNKFGKVSAISQ